MEKYILYGIGKAYQNFFSTSNVCDKMLVAAVVDKSLEDGCEFALPDGRKVIGYSSLNAVKEPYTEIVVTPTNYYQEIRNDLIAGGAKCNIITLDEWGYERLLSRGLLMMSGTGVDIGGPTRFFEPIYLAADQCDIVNFSKHNKWSELGDYYYLDDKKVGRVIAADATDLRLINDGAYDFVLSSNNMEHLANPLKALYEWKRILKAAGTMIVLVPAKDYTFDHKRDITLLEHLVSDYESNIEEDDLSHLEEILRLHDLNMDKAAGTYEDFKERSLHNAENRCLHQHVFDGQLLKDMAGYVGLEVVLSDIVYRANHVIVMRKN